MKKYCIIANNQKDTNFELANEIVDKITKLGGKCCIVSRTEYNEEVHNGPTDVSKISSDIECALVLGGDGTLIRAARDLYELDVPILGINLGTLGFLTEVEIQNIDETLKLLIDDEYTIQNRMMIAGNIESDGTVIYDDVALNDIVIGRNGFSRIMSVNVYVNGELVNNYLGDGVIISTPTGSTGYNLSAGGPIVKPNSRLMVITPICSHSLANRSIIVDVEDKITIEIAMTKKTQKDEAIATFDGRMGIELKAGDRINVSKGERMIRLISVGKRGFFDIIRDKLNTNRLENER